MTLLRPALLSGQCQLRSQTRAVRLLLSSDRRSISGVEVTESNVDDPLLVACVTGALEGLSIDEAPKSALTVDYTVRFTPR